MGSEGCHYTERNTWRTQLQPFEDIRLVLQRAPKTKNKGVSLSWRKLKDQPYQEYGLQWLGRVTVKMSGTTAKRASVASSEKA